MFHHWFGLWALPVLLHFLKYTDGFAWLTLSWDYLLNRQKKKHKRKEKKKDTKKKKWARCQWLLPWRVALCSSLSPFGGNNGMFTLLPKEQAHVTVVKSTKRLFSSVLHSRYRPILLQCSGSERSLCIDLLYLCDRPPLMVAMLVAMLCC